MSGFENQQELCSGETQGCKEWRFHSKRVCMQIHSLQDRVIWKGPRPQMRGIDFINLKHLPEGSLSGLFSGREHWWTSFFIGALYLASVRAGGCHFCTLILTSEQWQVNSPTPWMAPSDVTGEQGAPHTTGTTLGPALPCAVLGSPLALPRNKCRPFVFCTFPLLPFTTYQLGTRIFTYCCHLITTHFTLLPPAVHDWACVLQLYWNYWYRSDKALLCAEFHHLFYSRFVGFLCRTDGYLYSSETLPHSFHGGSSPRSSIYSSPTHSRSISDALFRGTFPHFPRCPHSILSWPLLKSRFSSLIWFIIFWSLLKISAMGSDNRVPENRKLWY